MIILDTTTWFLISTCGFLWPTSCIFNATMCRDRKQIVMVSCRDHRAYAGYNAFWVHDIAAGALVFCNVKSFCLGNTISTIVVVREFRSIVVAFDLQLKRFSFPPFSLLSLRKLIKAKLRCPLADIGASAANCGAVDTARFLIGTMLKSANPQSHPGEGAASGHRSVPSREAARKVPQLEHSADYIAVNAAGRNWYDSADWNACTEGGGEKEIWN